MAKNKELSKKIDEAFKLLLTARNVAIDSLIGIVTDAGGFIPTLPSDRKCTINAYEDVDGEVDVVTVFGLRVYDGELYLCTSDNVSNYEYDHGYSFEYLYNFEDEDLEHANKMLSSLENFTNFFEEDFLRSATIFSILAGLAEYV